MRRVCQILLGPLVMLGTLAWPDRGFPETIERSSISYFTVAGRTAAELDRELARRGPFADSTGGRHPGATRIRFGGTLDYRPRGGQCLVRNIKVTVSTRMILPRWVNRNRAEPGLQLIWDTLVDDIKRHEQQHVEIARTYARRLDRQLRALGTAPTCVALQARVADLTDAVSDAHDAQQLRFDAAEARTFESRLIDLLNRRLRDGTARIPPSRPMP